MLKLFFRCLRIFIFCCVISFPGLSQSVFVPLNPDYHHLLDRLEIKSGQLFPSIHSQFKPYTREQVAFLSDTIAGLESRPLSRVDRFNIDYLRNDNWEWSQKDASNSRKALWKHMYRKKSDLYHYQDKKFDFHLNPVLLAYVGHDSDQEETPYLNSRGVEIRGMIGRKLGFYSFLTDNQATFPRYVNERITRQDAVPGEGFYKTTGNNGVDFLHARGYITLDAIDSVMSIQFGYDKNFIGNGYRSLILSDFSSNYLFLKINTNIWKFNYQNIFGQLTAETLNGDGFFPQKYFAHHQLSVQIGKNLNLGLYESIIFNRGDTSTSGNSSGNFDFRYLNPVIFYRSIEQQAGSPDNAVLGLDFKWNFARRFSLYGQLVIDEFVLSEIRSGNGWRGNKQAGQIGLKYIDAFGVDNLDFQTEINVARPYIYSHNFPQGEFSNYNQELVHPLGANFYEFIGIMRFQPIPRLNVVSKLIYARYGADSLGSNWGQDIFLNNSDFEREFGNTIAQGVLTQLYYFDLRLSWQLKHNLFIELQQIYRRIDSDLPDNNRESSFTNIAIRWNIPQRFYAF